MQRQPGRRHELVRQRAAALAVAAVLIGLGAGLACSGEHQAPGETLDVAIAKATLAARGERQATLRASTGRVDRKQILFGDLHVHTTFSPHAFMMSLPLMGGSGLHPPADACDLARLCAALRGSRLRG